jgi:V/A-type H+-transporting ATPase subunit C
MLRINEGDYAYASARIRAREPKLLGKSHYDRMLEAPTAVEAYKVLTESEYGVAGSGTGSVFDFEKLLSDEMHKCYLLLMEIAPQAELVKAFQRRHDYFNIKVLLKAEFSGKQTPPILMETGTIGSETISRMIRERDYSELTPIMQEVIGEIRDVFSRTQDPQTVDLLLDRASYRQLTEDLNDIGSPYLHKIARIMTDITNIKMFIRARSLNKSWDFIRNLLLEGGSIQEKVWFENSEKPVDDFVEGIRTTEYGEATGKGWELFKTKSNISGLEKLLDDFLMKFVREAKMVTMGVEPLIAYLFAKETEIRNVRIIMTGKINELPVDLIRERLREGYV